MAAHTSNDLDAHLEQINARLPNATPHAAYALGMLTVVHIETGKPIPHVILDAALDVTSAAGAFRLGEQARELAHQDEKLDRRRQKCGGD